MAEAQACGTPVIALDRGGARDIVEHGRTGWLLPSATVEALREAVKWRGAKSSIRSRSAVAPSASPRPAFERRSTLAVDDLVETAQAGGLERLGR